MGKSAGLMTEFKTEAGRPIYISDDGEIVSEKSVTIKMGNKFVNVPSIHDGIQYSEDELAEMIQNKEIKPTSTHKTEKLAVKAAEKRSPSLMSEDTARAVEDKYKEEIVVRTVKSDPSPTMRAPLMELPELPVEKAMKKKEMDEQMITFAEGGLLDEGGTVDPVSGNEVPAGSTQEEVRDDIPAQLSEGEFVFPADVVRYIGLENLMKLRQKAKAGLKLMEDMGQMGNAEEAVMDDDLKYIAEVDMLIDNFDPEEEETRNFAVGGYNPPKIPNFSGTTYKAPTASDIVFGGGSGVSPFGNVQSPVQYSSEEYIGPNGERITVTLINGKPVNPPPPGYKKYDPTKAVTAAPTVAQPKVAQPTVTGGEDNRQRDAEEAGRIAQEKELSNLIAKYNPEFAKVWSQDPFNTGKLGATGLAGAILGSVKSIGARTDAIPGILETFGLDPKQFENTGLAGSLPGNKYDIGKLTNTLRTADILVEQLGIEKDKIADIIEYTDLDSDGDGEITKDDLIDDDGKLTRAGQDLFMEIDGEDPADTPPAPSVTRGKDITTEVREQLAQQRDDSSSDDRDSEDSGTTGSGSASAAGGEDTEAIGSFSKGGTVQEQTKRALKSSRKK